MRRSSNPELAHSAAHQFTKSETLFVWAGGGLFISALAFCAYSYLVTWSSPNADVQSVSVGRGPTGVGGANRWAILALDLALFTVFAAHHSLLARDRTKAWLACFVPLCLRGAVFAVSSDPAVIVAAQLLDGVSAATLGVLVPLVIADSTRGSGHFNFAQGVVGVAVGLGASLGTTLAGYVADAFGGTAVFAFLGSVGAAGFLLVLAFMPETREPQFLAAAGGAE